MKVTQIGEKMNYNGKVLFIVHDVHQDDNHFPSGIGYMAAALKQEGYEVSVYCQDVFHFTNEELAEVLKNNDYDLICIGFMAARFRETIIDLCATINKYKKNAWLILGGHGPSPIPEYVLETTSADIVVIGEGEETIVDLLRYKINNWDLHNLKGIAFRLDKNVFINERRKPIKNLDAIPFPEYSLFPMDKYTSCLKMPGMETDDKALGIVTSRGCVNRCNFCYRMEKGIRFRSVTNTVEEINLLNHKYGVNYFVIYDELFVSKKERIFEFQDALEHHDLKIKYSCSARVDLFDEEIINSLKESGCTFVNFGMESSDQNVLNLMNKNTTIEQNIKAAELTKSAGIGIGLNFIWDNIGDTEESLKNNIELIKKYNNYDQLRTIRPVTPYPGCDLYYEAINRGLLSGPDDFFNKFKNSDLFTVNFTNLPDNKFYQILFEANKELIMDYYINTSNDIVAANDMINDFYNLYFEGEIEFRGARHYIKK